MTPFNTARKAMLHLLELFPAPLPQPATPGFAPPTPAEPSPVRLLLLDIDSYLESLPALEITQRDEALIAARNVVEKSRLLLKIAELHETIAELRCVSDARAEFDTVPACNDIALLKSFYRVDSAVALIAAQAQHIAKLQRDLRAANPLGTLAPVQVRT